MQAIDTVRKSLATGQLEAIVQPLFEQVVQKNISKVASKSTPDQTDQLLAKVTEELPKIQQQFLQEAVAKEELANATPKADINLLKQSMCSIGPIDQIADPTLLVENTYNRNYSIVPNDIDHVNLYTKCVGL